MDCAATIAGEPVFMGGKTSGFESGGKVFGQKRRHFLCKITRLAPYRPVKTRGKGRRTNKKLNVMKTKLLVLTAALIGAASLSANAGVFVSINFPLPRIVVAAPVPPVPVIVTAPAPVVCAAPVITPVAYTAPVTPVVETVPPCPVEGYVWVPGYWGVGHVWVGGCWRPGPAVHVGAWHYDRDNDRHYDNDHHYDRGHDYDRHH